MFPFTYLQRTGPGSRTLCVPSVSSTFEWDGKKVSTLAKSGGIIYILADSFLPDIDEVKLWLHTLSLCLTHTHTFSSAVFTPCLQSEGSSDEDQKLPDTNVTSSRKDTRSSESGRFE